MSRWVVCETSSIVFLCVLILFLFPASTGPYPAVHGPATALRAAVGSTQISAMTEGALHSFASRDFLRFKIIFPSSPVKGGEGSLVAVHAIKDVLRC